MNSWLRRLGIHNPRANSPVPHNQGRAALLSRLDLRPRVALFFFASVIGMAASGVSGAGFAARSADLMLAGLGVWVLWFGLMVMIALPATDRLLSNHTAWLGRGALTIFIILATFALLESAALITFHSWFRPADNPDGVITKSLVALEQGFTYNDATALCHQAAENLLNGKNPYAHANIVGATLKFGGTLDRLTVLRLGKFEQVFPLPEPRQVEQLWDEAAQNPEQVPPELESKVCYPAGCFLTPIPLLAAGITDLRLIYLIFVLAALAGVVLFIPGRMKLVFGAAAMASLVLWNSIASGENGVLVFPLLLIAWALVKKKLWVSAVFMGLAIATKQTAWFYLPFYLILVFWGSGLKRLVPVTAAIGGIFLAVNAPFIAAGPGLWFTSLLAPMRDSLFPSGVGVVSLVLAGVWNIQSSLVFTVMEGLVFVLGIAWYFRYCRQYPAMGPVLAILPLFFAWRSLWPYFFYADLIIIAFIIINEYQAEAPRQVVVVSPIRSGKY